MENIKDAFQRVKGDIISLYKEMDSLRHELKETNDEMVKICEVLEKINKKIPETNDFTQKVFSTHKPPNQTTSTHPSTHNLPLEPLKAQNLPISTGNGGVPTDRQQTDNRQTTDRKTPIFLTKSEDSIDNAAEILDSLDNAKKEIRLKFKRLTDQEVLVFSVLYQLEEETGFINYKTVADRLNLSESSIRDYVGRLIKKGIPVEKHKTNNKQIHLKISKNLKKIASLPTILQLRDL